MTLSAQIYRSSEVNNQLCNQYGEEMRALAKKADIDNPIGFSRSVVIKDGEVYETTIVFFRDKDGETHDRIVRARLLSYGIAGDTTTAQKEPELINSDSLSFKAKSVTKQKDGYLVVGNVSDRGVEIPVVLSTAKPQPKAPEPRQLRFAQNGNPFNANGRIAGCMFKCIDSADVILVKLVRNDRVSNFYGTLTDDCYSDTFLVPLIWWNGGRNGLSWEAQRKVLDNYRF